MLENKLYGCVVPIVTPLDGNQKVDVESLRSLVRFLIGKRDPLPLSQRDHRRNADVLRGRQKAGGGDRCEGIGRKGQGLCADRRHEPGGYGGAFPPRGGDRGRRKSAW